MDKIWEVQGSEAEAEASQNSKGTPYQTLTSKGIELGGLD